MFKPGIETATLWLELQVPYNLSYEKERRAYSLSLTYIGKATFSA